MNDSINSFSVLTWNLHGCVGIDGRMDIVRTVRIIRSLSPDIAAFQEVDLRRQSGCPHEINTYLREQVGENFHEAWTVTGVDGNYGQILVSRFPLVEKQIHDISVTGCEPRKVLDVIVQLSCFKLRVIATHLGLWPGEKHIQINRLRNIVQSDSSLPVVLLGDLNEGPFGKAGRVLSGLFDDVTTFGSYPSVFPVFKLDRIMSRGSLKMKNSQVLRKAFMASDHLPVAARFDLDGVE